MKWIEVKVIITSGETELLVDLISDIFHELGTKGVVMEDPDMVPEEGWGDDAEKGSGVHSVTGYFPKNDFSPKRCRALESGLEKLKTANEFESKLIYNSTDEKNWAESWKAYFHPVKIGKTLVVKPTWREYEKKSGDVIIEIDPGMAFGTGTHPTTVMCMEMMEHYFKKGTSFLDIGTGSGILMLTAAKLGAESIMGIDTDEVAIDITKENLIKNGVDSKRFNLRVGNLADTIQDTYGFIAANILSQVILVFLEDVSRVLKPGGLFLCSGIIEENKKPVLEKMETNGFEIIDEQIRETWVSILGKRPLL